MPPMDELRFSFGLPPSDNPFSFSVDLPEGNYDVGVTLGDPEGASETTVRAESRRLMLEKVRTGRGETVERTFTVNIRNARLDPPPENAPGGSRVLLKDREIGALHWDDRLTLEFLGGRPRVSALRIREAPETPTVFLTGDSTVTDQPAGTYYSWGQMLPRFFRPGIAVANHAESGETLKSFLAELRLAKVLSLMKAGDWLFVQFGHNDQKEQWPQTYVDPLTTYAAYLRVFIAEARLRGTHPVLVTPPHRRQFDERGRIRNTLAGFPDAMRAVAAEQGIPLIDLNAMSAVFYETLGPERAPLAFAEEGRDATHHGAYGAYELARCVVEGIREKVPELARRLAEDMPRFDPARPDPV